MKSILNKSLRILAFILFFIITSKIGFSQTTPTITITAKNPGNYFHLLISSETPQTPIHVDWGDGNKMSFVIDTMTNSFYSPLQLAGLATIKIYGLGISLFNCSSNEITNLDVSNCSSLKKLYCEKNYIDSLDLSKNINLNTIDCSNNRLIFSKLPIPKSTYIQYTYAPQNPFPVKRSTIISENIDLKKLLTSTDALGIKHNTYFTWRNGIGDTLVEGIDYAIAEPGVFYLLKKPAHTIFCEMKNDLFPKFIEHNIFRTSCKTPDGLILPMAFSFQTSKIGSIGSLYLTLATLTDSTSIKIDWGNGVPVSTELNFTTKAFSNPQFLNGYTTIKVYAEGIRSISSFYSNITSIDVTKCKTLNSLKLVYNSLQSINLTQNKELNLLDLSDNKIASSDFSFNKKLEYLFLSNNGITSLNISNNILLKSLNCSYNKLHDLDLSNNTLLENINCSSNLMNFETLPKCNSRYKEYLYAPQALYYANSLNSGSTCDLTYYLSALDINNNYQTTQYNWRRKNETLQLGVDYQVVQPGLFRILNVPSSIFYCEMTNSAFPDLQGIDALKFVYLMAPALTISTDALTEFSYSLKADADSNLIIVHYGSQGYYSYYNYNSIDERTTADPILIYGEGFKTLQIQGEIGLTTLNIDASNAKDLKKVSLFYNDSLKTISFSPSNSIDTLDCFWNNISSLNVSKLSSLKYLHCGINNLTALDVRSNTKLTNLICFDNKLTSIDLTKNTLLTNLSVRTNYLSTLDISKNTQLTFLSCRDNKLNFLDVSNNNLLTELYCFGNNLTFQNLPQPKAKYSIYKYAPQNNLTISKSIETNKLLDLSSQIKATDINGNIQTTTFNWKTIGGKLLIDGADYTVSEAGKFIFKTIQTDSVYCFMSNPVFPDFKADTIFRTSTAKIITTVGINDFSNQERVFVTTANKFIYVHVAFANKNTQISVCDINGRCVSKKLVNEAITEIEVSSPGVYLVQIAQGNQVQVEKVAVKF